jgi:hypothetical protein
MANLFKAVKPHYYTLKAVGYFPFHFDHNLEVRTSLVDVTWSLALGVFFVYTSIKRIVLLGGSLARGSSWSEVNVGLGPVVSAIYAVFTVLVNFVERKNYEGILTGLSSFDVKVCGLCFNGYFLKFEV